MLWLRIGIILSGMTIARMTPTAMRLELVQGLLQIELPDSILNVELLNRSAMLFHMTSVHQKELLKIRATRNDGEKIFGSSNSKKSVILSMLFDILSGHCQHYFWIFLFLEASCFFWVSTLLLITDSWLC